MKFVVHSIILSLCFSLTLFAGGYKVGDVATDFSLKGVGGRMTSLADDPKAKGFIVVFTCNHCPYAKAYEDRIIALQKKYSPLQFPVVAINPNDTAQVPEDSFTKMIERSNEKSFPFPYLIDASQEIARAYGATRTPHVFVLSRENGKLIVRYIGAIDDQAEDAAAVKLRYVEQAVDALLKGSQPNPDFVKAIGCTIKWAKK